MNNKARIIAYLKQYGRSACREIEQMYGMGDATSRVSEINKSHRTTHGRNLIKTTYEQEFNSVTGRDVPVGYYEFDESPASPDLFNQ